MKKFLVPTDFSDTSKNAARYAVQMAATIPDSKIILYNVFDKIAAGSDGSPLTETLRIEKLSLTLRCIILNWRSVTPQAFEIEFVAEENSSLIEAMTKYVKYNGIDLVIMGITGATRLEQIFMGSNTLNFII